MAKNQAAPLRPRATPTAARQTNVVPTGRQDDNPMNSPASKSSNKTGNLDAWNQRRSGSAMKK